MLSIEDRQVIAGRYRLERPLARGGMGSVWVARHLQLEIDVAVKFMTRELAASPAARARFEREARASAQLKSPNVIQVHDYGVEDDTPFLVMELLEGETLEARVEREGRLSPEDTAAVLVPVCRALRRAHEMGLVHRDLKPDNVFLARGGDEVTPKVLDFGIAKLRDPGPVGSSTKTGALLGTPHYMSPEQVRKSSTVDHRSDLWSIGVIVFRCLTGALPFPGDEIGDVLVAICAEPIPRASDLAEGLGPEVDRFFERALSRDVARRFQSARELAEALAALSGETFRPSLVMSMSSEGVHAATASAREPPSQAQPVLPVEAPASSAGPPPQAPAATTLASASPPPGQAPVATTLDSAGPPPPQAPAAATHDTVSAGPPTPAAVPATLDTVSRTLTSEVDQGAGPPAVAPPSPRSPPRRSRAGVVALAAVLVAAVGLFAARSRLPGSRQVPAAGSACVHDADCAAGGVCSAGLCVARPGCAGNRECTARSGGRPAICRGEDGACVALESEDCRVLAAPGDVENDATLWIGAMFPAPAGDAHGAGVQARNSMELARRDFAATTGGLLPARPGGPKRPIGVVFCDDSAVASTTRAAEHLVDVRVPAIIGFARSKEVLDLAQSLFVPRGVLALASNMASSLRDIPRAPGGARLVWRI